MFRLLHHASEQVSTMTAAYTGAAGSATAITAAVVDPSLVEPWLRIASLSVGLLTGLGAGGLVALKYWDRWGKGAKTI